MGGCISWAFACGGAEGVLMVFGYYYLSEMFGGKLCMIKLAGDGVWAFHDCSCSLGLTNRYAHWARGPSNYYVCGANFSRM